MAGIREANRRFGAAERIEEMAVVNMFEVENAGEEESKFPIRRRHKVAKPKPPDTELYRHTKPHNITIQNTIGYARRSIQPLS